MKKHILFLFILLFLSITTHAQSFHTITIDGTNDFVNSSERFETTSGTELYAYVTWDDDYFYFGLSGNSVAGLVTDANRVFHLYFDTDPVSNPTEGFGTTTGESSSFVTPILPFSANYHYTFYTSGNTEVKKFHDQSLGWLTATDETSNWKNFDTGFWEVKISKTAFGNSNQIRFIAYVEENWSGGSICGGLPSNLFTNTNSQGTITFNNNFKTFYLLDQFNPNASFSQNNFSWLIRLSAATSALSDTNIFAGMSVNATDGFDNGIDIAKPPAPSSNFIDVYFDQPGWTTSNLGSSYSRNIKKLVSLDSSTTYWDFKVNTDQSNSTVTLSAKDYEFVPSNYEIYLYDNSIDSSHNFRSSPSYQYNSGTSSVRQFRLTVGLISTPPVILVSDDTLDFGSILLGSDSSKSITIENIGIDTLEISSITTTNESFSIVGSTSLSIPNNGSAQIEINFSPSSAVTYSDSLIIASNDSDTPNYIVLLNGTGVAPTPNISSNVNSLNFGFVKVDYDSTLSYKIYNTGTRSLSIINITTATDFFSVNGTTSFNIAVSDSASRTLTFSPDEVTSYTDTLFITSDDPDTPELAILLSGSGTTSSHVKALNAGWNLISFPVEPENSFAGSVIGDDISNYLFYNYSSSGGYFAEDSILVGKGYWLGIQSADTIDIEGTPLVDSISIPLSEGWNIISSPYVRAYPSSKIYFKKDSQIYSASEAVSSNWIYDEFFAYNNDSSNYSVESTLSQWNGYWALSSEPGLSALFYPDSTTGDPLRKNEKENLRIDINNWYVDISAEFNDTRDNLLRFGTNINATDNIELKYDIPKPPVSPSSNSVYTYFRNNAFSSSINSFAYDIRAPYDDNSTGKSWKFYVRTKGSGQVTLSWKNILETIPQEILTEYSFILTGFGIPSSLDIEASNQFSFNSADGENYEFTINSVVTSLEDEVIPYKFTLDQNYPNPFNPITTISYEVPEDGFVSLLVYDLLGNEIQELVSENQKAGRYNIQFNGSQLSTGVYFYKLLINDKKAVKKMILLK
ncbi:MAG: hypothetical protein CMF23_18345 [Ignavibacteriae bacterium]|nr:hypothetical protein [Ignavibacteriota bacterium]